MPKLAFKIPQEFVSWYFSIFRARRGYKYVFFNRQAMPTLGVVFS